MSISCVNHAGKLNHIDKNWLEHHCLSPNHFIFVMVYTGVHNIGYIIPVTEYVAIRKSTYVRKYILNSLIKNDKTC